MFSFLDFCGFTCEIQLGWVESCRAKLLLVKILSLFCQFLAVQNNKWTTLFNLIFVFGEGEMFLQKDFRSIRWLAWVLVVFYRTLKETPLTIWTPKIYSYAYLIATTLNILFTRHHCKCKTIAAFLLYQLLAKPSLPAMTLCEWIHFYLISFTVCWCSIMWKCEAEKHIFVSALQFSLRKSYLTYRTLNDIHCLFFVGISSSLVC